MALVLVLLLAWTASRKDGLAIAAIGIQVVNMIVPQVFKPAAIVWFGASHVLGAVMTRVVLSIVYFGVVTPVGLWRRAIGKDALQLRSFRSGRGSVMAERNHTFTASDIEQPY